MFVGIDYSLTSPATVIIDKHGKTHVFAYTKKKNVGTKVEGDFTFHFKEYPVGYKTNIERYQALAFDVLMFIYKFLIKSGTHECSEKIRLEGYAYSANGKVFNLAENMGVLKYVLSTTHMTYEIIAPTSLKKFATGKGNANKVDMYTSFVEATGIDLKALLGEKTKATNVGSPTSDIVDAYFIAKSIVDGIKADPDQ